VGSELLIFPGRIFVSAVLRRVQWLKFWLMRELFTLMAYLLTTVANLDGFWHTLNKDVVRRLLVRFYRPVSGDDVVAT
jgi:hypothetical protein